MINSKPWQQKKELTANDVKYILQTNLPELTIKTLSPLGNGWDNTTWLINNEWVFRLPKHEEAAQLLRNEINTLPHLPKLNIDFPKPKFICLEPRGFDYPIYGHHYLRGTNADCANLTLQERENLAGDLGRFLKRLHAFPLAKAIHLNIGYDQKERANVKLRYQKTQERLVYLTEHQLFDHAMLFIDYFKEHLSLSVPEEWILGHGDLYAKHILLNEHKQFCAVIDWGDCELMSPAIDLRIVYQFLPPQAHQTFWEAYGQVSNIMQTLAKLSSIYSAVTLVWYADQVSDKSLLTEALLGLEFLRETINAGY